ncbi:C-type mannose receptor 2-like [Hoplias malabaricus]|uniref:C-type mannose receptor 2-like n=1 Tax=Hoplias malabaricus TaxID=27720 RepID=UPI00346248F6
MEVAQKAYTDHVWLGLRHTCKQGFWFWISGYQNWAPGNGIGGEACGSGERPGVVESAAADVPYQYHFVNENKTWTEAQSYCRQNYTDLVTVNNMEEMMNLNTTLKNNTTSSVWIGLKRGNTGRWLWSLADGDLYREGAKYRNWSSGQPNNTKGNESCVTMSKQNGTWYDESCDTHLGFMCYDEKSSSYITVKGSFTWREAQNYCRVNYTDLVSARNQTENQIILNNGPVFNRSIFWIGLFNDSWQWSDQSYSSFRYWASTQPDDTGGSQNCTAVSMTEGDAGGSWFDEDCDCELPFVCREDQLVLVNLTLTWRDALRYCRTNHSDLVSVTSAEIQSWVMEVAQKAYTDHIWLGLRHTCTLGFWFWVSGESICYQDWAPGNGTEAEDCCSLERCGAVESFGGQHWVSLPEAQTLNFICTN